MKAVKFTKRTHDTLPTVFKILISDPDRIVTNKFSLTKDSDGKTWYLQLRLCTLNERVDRERVVFPSFMRRWPSRDLPLIVNHAPLSSASSPLLTPNTSPPAGPQSMCVLLCCASFLSMSCSVCLCVCESSSCCEGLCALEQNVQSLDFSV
jgi:hypothetical protein